MNEDHVHIARLAVMAAAAVAVAVKFLYDVAVGMAIADQSRRDSYTRHVVFCAVVHAAVLMAAVVGYVGSRTPTTTAPIKPVQASRDRKSPMLLLDRRKGERIIICGEIVIDVVSIHKGKVRLGIKAPCEIPIKKRNTEQPCLPTSRKPISAPTPSSTSSPGSAPR